MCLINMGARESSELSDVGRTLLPYDVSPHSSYSSLSPYVFLLSEDHLQVATPPVHKTYRSFHVFAARQKEKKIKVG